jgi:hypothetical protein
MIQHHYIKPDLSPITDSWWHGHAALVQEPGQPDTLVFQWATVADCQHDLGRMRHRLPPERTIKPA